MNPPVVILIIIGTAIVILLIVLAARAAAARERTRLAALAEWANRNGFSFLSQDSYDLDGRFSGVLEIGRGHARCAFEILSRSEPVPVWLFRYQFRTWETRTVVRDNRTYTERYEQTHWRAYLIVELGAAFPQLALRTENWLDKVVGFVGFDDIDFESEQFSSRYHVKSADKQFAYAVIHPQMMEWLLARPFAGQIENGLFIQDLSGVQYDASVVEAAWSGAAGFVNRIPPFVWQDYGKRERVEFAQTAQVPIAPPVPQTVR